MTRPGEGIIGEPNDGLPEHSEVCPVCGQAFDARLLDLVIYHDQHEHDIDSSDLERFVKGCRLPTKKPS